MQTKIQNQAQDEEAKSDCSFPRLKDIPLPSSIMALPHVLEFIDTLLMSPEEAAVEAARTGQSEWLDNIIAMYKDCDVKNALVAAAGSGHLDILRKLYFHIEPTDEEQTKVIAGYIQGAATCAAEKGHSKVIKFLLSERVNLVQSRMESTCLGLVPALEYAAGGGHIGIVKFMVNHAKRKDYVWVYTRGRIDALSHAIYYGRNDVTEYLLSLLKEFHWNLKTAFVAAICTKHKKLAERIYEVYPTTIPYEVNLFVDLACKDIYLRAVKYLYENSRDDSILIADAFIAAADRGSTKTLDFFLDTGRVSNELFDKVLKKAAGSYWSEQGFVFLYDKKRATPTAINQAFTITKSFDIIKLLYENEQISEDSTITAFRKAFETSSKYDSKRDKTRIDTVKYLSKATCIPAEVIGEAFSHAAEHHDNEIMSFLREDARLSPNQVFLAAAMFDHRKLLKAVYDVERISPETILTAFTESSTYAEISKDISKYLCQRSHVPQAMRQKAFIHAAK